MESSDVAPDLRAEAARAGVEGEDEHDVPAQAFVTGPPARARVEADTNVPRELDYHRCSDRRQPTTSAPPPGAPAWVETTMTRMMAVLRVVRGARRARRGVGDRR